jgi:DNA modification methylase
VHRVAAHEAVEGGVFDSPPPLGVEQVPPRELRLDPSDPRTVSGRGCGARDLSDVWGTREPDASPLHGAQKPLELRERAIEHSSRPGDLALDLCAGSGSTLIAAERTGRLAAAMGVDPTDCAVIVARQAALTGGGPELIPPDDDGADVPGGAR